MRDKTEIREPDGPRRRIEKSAYLLPPLLAVSCDNPSIILIPGERDGEFTMVHNDWANITN